MLQGCEAQEFPRRQSPDPQQICVERSQLTLPQLGAGVLVGTGVLVATGTGVFVATGVLVIPGGLVGTGVLVAPGTGVLVGPCVLVGTGVLVDTGTGVFVGAGQSEQGQFSPDSHVPLPQQLFERIQKDVSTPGLVQFPPHAQEGYQSGDAIVQSG